MKKVSIITVNYNQLQLTLDLLKSLEDQSYSNVEIYVVDNASEEDPTKKINDAFPKVKVIRSEVNLGFAGGNNLAIEKALGDYLFFVNNDTEIPDGTLFNLVSRFENNSQAGVISPLIYYYDQPSKIQYAGYTPLNKYTCRNEAIGFGTELQMSNQLVKTEYAHGAAMMVSKKAILEVGMMDENYFLYYEELDWVERIRRYGFEVYVDHSSHILHKESMTIGKASPLKIYFQTRNRILFARKNFDLLNRALFITFFLGLSLPKNVIQYFIERNVVGLKSFLAGLFWNFTNGIKSEKLGYKYDDLKTV